MSAVSLSEAKDSTAAWGEVRVLGGGGGGSWGLGGWGSKKSKLGFLLKRTEGGISKLLFKVFADVSLQWSRALRANLDPKP